jgi:RHS repeat-associated protein
MTYDDWGRAETEPKMDLNFAGLEQLNDYGGYTYDEVLDLYYVQNRFYDPADRRWTSPDPHWDPDNLVYGGNGTADQADGLAAIQVTLHIRAAIEIQIAGPWSGAAGTDTLPPNPPDPSALAQSANLYAYVLDNPLRYVDPWGLVAVDAREYAKTYKGAEVTYTTHYYDDSLVLAVTYMTVTLGDASFNVYQNPYTPNGVYSFISDDSVFVNAFGVGTDKIVVYPDETTGNVSIRAGFNISGDGADLAIDGTTYKALFIQGIKERWSSGTVSVYAEETSTGINVKINTTTGVSNVNYGLFGLLDWTPSNLGRTTMYRGDSRGTGTNYSAEQFMIMAAHEFGHNLGIRDGYKDAVTQYYDSIMCDQFGYRNGTTKASALDIAKMLIAFEEKKAQKWS